MSKPKIVPIREYPFKEIPMLVAHRGSSQSGAPENSVEAAAAAIEAGADMVEIDVQITKDDIFVCYHDAKVPGSDASIEELNLAELVAQCQRENIEPPATLAVIIEYLRGKAYLNIELKEHTTREPSALLSRLQRMLEQEDMLDYAIISSFRIDLIHAAGWSTATVIIHAPGAWHALFPDLGNAALFAQPDELPSAVMQRSGATGYACTLNELSELAVNDIAKHNYYLSLYTIYGEEDFRAAMAVQPCAIVCENIAQARSLRDSILSKT